MQHTVILFVFSALLASAASFSLDQSAVGSKKWTHQRSVEASRPFSRCAILKSKNADLFDEKKLKEMEDMILSLSLEPTDDSRRERLKSILAEELAKPNGVPKQFSDLFDYTLIIVGDRVKAEAQERAAKLNAKSEESPTEETPDSEENQEGEAPPPFPKQRQLWALVDMMIQSKTIVKRASDDLGSNGSFQ